MKSSYFLKLVGECYVRKSRLTCGYFVLRGPDQEFLKRQIHLRNSIVRHDFNYRHDGNFFNPRCRSQLQTKTGTEVLLTDKDKHLNFNGTVVVANYDWHRELL
jgi:hypothetical protein